MNLLNIHNNRREIYLFFRDENGKPITKIDKNFYPYYYEPHPEGAFFSYDGVQLKKIFVSDPSMIKKVRTSDSYESDIAFVRRYLIDKVKEIVKTTIKYAHIDIEVLSPNEFPEPKFAKYPVSSISIFNSVHQKVKDFWLKDYLESENFNEQKLLFDFMTYMKSERFDLWCVDEETLINTDNGLKTAKNLEYQDKLLSYKNNNFCFSDINNIQKSRKKCKKIILNSNELIASENHLHPVLSWKISDTKECFFNNLKTTTLKRGDYLCLPISYNQDKGFRSNYYWLLGYYYGDGNKGGRFDLKDNNKNLIKKIQDLLKLEFYIPSKISKIENHYVLYSYNTKAKHLLLKFKLFYKDLLKNLHLLPIEYQMSFMEGFIDAEGTYDSKYHKLGFVNTDLELMKYLSNLSYSVGLPNNISLFNPPNGRKKICFINFYINKNISNLQLKHDTKNPFTLLINKNNKKDVIPIRKFLINLYDKWNIKKPKKLLEYHKNTITRKKVLELLKNLKKHLKSNYRKQYIIRLEKFINNFHFDKIKKIKNMGIRNVIELNLVQSPYFVANNILTHNCSWNVGFDYNYLYNRVKNLMKMDFAKEISPITQNRRPNMMSNDDIYYPAGISIVDLLDWYKKFTLNKKKSYKLDNVAQDELKEEEWGETDFGELSDRVRAKNNNDVIRMHKIEQKHQIIPYFDAIRRLSKCLWEDLYFNSRIFEMLLLEEAKNKEIILPKKKEDAIKKKFEGATRDSEKGFYKGLTKYDLGSAYPRMIVDFCLDPANISEEPIENSVKIDIKNKESGEVINTYWYKQNSKTILPITINKILTLKEAIKKEKKNTPEDALNFKDISMKYAGIKAIANSGFGVFGNQYFRMYDYRIAETITFLARDLITYIKTEVDKLGYSVRYWDTDSIFVESREDLTDILNSLIKQWGNQYQNPKVSIEFEREGIFEKILLLTKCHYVGFLHTETGIEHEIKGIEAKKKNSGKYMAYFQKTLIQKILDEELSEEIKNWVKKEIKNMPYKSLTDIAIPTKLNKVYKKNTPIQLRAYNNTNSKIKFKKSLGEWFYYIYMLPKEYTMKKVEVGYLDGIRITTNAIKKAWKEYFKVDKILKKDMTDEMEKKLLDYLYKAGRLEVKIEKIQDRAMDVFAFDEKNINHIKNEDIDWKKMIELNITNKADVIFDAMGWNMKEVMI